MASKTWTREAIICAIQRWAMQYDEPPRLMHWKLARNGYPSSSTVKEEFGTWNRGLVAAGYPPRPRGNPGHVDPIGTMEKINA